MSGDLWSCCLYDSTRSIKSWRCFLRILFSRFEDFPRSIRDRHARTDSDHSLISVLRWKTVREARNAKPKVGCLCVSDGIVQLTCRNVFACILAVKFDAQPRFFIYFIITQSCLIFSRRWCSILPLVQLVLTFFPFSSFTSFFLFFFDCLLQSTTLG